MKNICILAEKDPKEYAPLDSQIKTYRKKIGICERIIARCDKEFEDCKIRREQDFKELFEIKQEQALVVIKKYNILDRIINKIKNKFNGYENFSKFVLQKHSAKLNRMRTETINEYINKTKRDRRSFDSEMEVLLSN